MNTDDLDSLFGDKPESHDKQDKYIEQKDNINKSSPELTKEQQLLILKEWETKIDDPPSIEELCELVFPGQKLDGRSKIGREIKKFLSEQNLQATTKTEYKPKQISELTNEQQEYIRNNLNMTALEQAKIIFNNNNLFNTNKETRIVLKYRNELKNEGIIFENDNDEEISEVYRPPKTLEQVCARINKNIDGIKYDSKNLTPTQKKQCQTLMNYLHNLRFSHHLNLINNEDDRKLFQNTFVRYIYDKTDLSQEDLDQYLTLANEAVMESSIKRTISMLENEQQKSLDENGKISMAIVEALKTSRDEYNASINRQQRLYKALEVERSKRLNERIGPQFTLLNIVEEFKNEQRRKEWIEAAEERNKRIGKEIDRLSKFDEGIVRIYGINSDLVFNG